MKKRIYLDYNASTPMRPESRKAFLDTIDVHESVALNASSVHYFGREAAKIIESARHRVAALVNTPASQVIFNSGATESNNTVLRYFKDNYPDEAVLVSAIEHPSVLQAIKEPEILPVTSDGLIDLQKLEERLKKGPKVSLVSIMLVNNETGSILNVSDTSQIIHNHGIFLHCDATQAAGKLPLDITSLGADFLSLSAHKIGGPQGVGALALGSCGTTPTLLHGGGQEKSARAGTQNTAGIAAFGGAALTAQTSLTTEQKRLSALRDSMEKKLMEATPSLIIHGLKTPRVSNTSFFSLPGTSSEAMMMALDLEGIAVSNGSACSSGRVKASHVLTAMGESAEISSSALRVSIGWATTQDEIDTFLNAWETLSRRWTK